MNQIYAQDMDKLAFNICKNSRSQHSQFIIEHWNDFILKSISNNI